MDGHLQVVAPTSWREIERKTTHIQREWFREVLVTPQPFPVAHFIEYILWRERGIEVNSRTDLKEDVEGQLVPRKDGSPPKLDLPIATYDGMYAGDPRARFTAAHEGGHAWLHADQITGALITGNRKTLFRKTSQIEPYRNPERQADVFASRLLMPSDMVRLAVNNLGPDELALSSLFGVSLQAMRIRLKELGAL